MGDSTKIERYGTERELAEFFRELADALENGGNDELVCLQGFRKMKIAVKSDFGQLMLKARIKPACAGGEADDAEAKPKYSHLKKRMKSSFRLLVKMVHDGQMPPGEAVESFLEDSALMVTYPGYGDEYYDSYTRACDAFRAAFDAGDMPKMHETLDVLIHEKSRCHAKYD